MAFRSKDKEIVYQGIKFLVPTRDITIVPGLMNGYYELAEINIYKALLPSSKTILDVGANIGLYSLVGATYGKKTTKIYAFEPVPENIQYFKRSLQLNDIRPTAITLVESAVGAKEGKLKLNLSPITIGTHTAGTMVGPGVKTISVPMTTIDAFVQKHKLSVDILKIDIEGYEGFALRGAQATIKRQTPTILMEYLPELLAHTDFPAEEMRKLLFSHYTHCFVINDLTSQITLIDIKTTDLASFKGNLVLTNNPKHIKSIEQFV
ncbi:MAG TPA: FkbM family methyltransferase [Candidatus Saccharimonadales bacterium]|nr:FkbM family methyltransferase [Candidatus Saccharimonadales bacterium]